MILDFTDFLRLRPNRLNRSKNDEYKVGGVVRSPEEWLEFVMVVTRVMVA